MGCPGPSYAGGPFGLWLWLAALLVAACGEGGRPPSDAGPTPADAGRLADSGRDAGLAGDASTPTDGGSPGDAGAPDAGIATDPSGGSGGAYPGSQSRTASSTTGPVPYALYLPGSYEPSIAVPLLGVFHGQGGSGERMRDFWSDAAEAGGFAVLAITSTGSSGGWRGTDIALFDAALNDALGAYNVDRRRLHVWGFSAGAHLVHAVALDNASLFAAYSVSAGALDFFAGGDAPSRASRRIPVDVRVGTDDPLLAQARADRMRFLSAGWVEGESLRYVEFAGGHTLLPGHPADIWGFLSNHRVP